MCGRNIIGQIVVAGICVDGDCECMKYDGKMITDKTPKGLLPPYHEECSCFILKNDNDGGE